ncbi:serine/threonine protein kinase [Lentzea albidocapillata subsp. violacea]|uniref:non-specific serine/threonine protein kinase n=1 Tax=Lentzea albidocapillata subsp. violacea TaxID=128104 RepID=A0A1G8UD57_9PSEU|nr:serine/threonine-protein kinase [Lentzea albidocapillata]SDJ51693.1 serine/threonine protein kinase [Lentzea albidocapillata subsp. violacea]
MTEETFGPYRIEQLLGRGGMGEVHRAYDTAHDRFVALKRLSPGYHDDEDYRARFRREAQIVARLREPHVIPIHAYGEIDDRLYLDMRLVEGADLADVIREGTVEPARAVRIVDQVASALDASHADGLVHRDVKPSNVLVTPGDFVYLVDFGIARSVSPAATSLTASGSVVGTLDYMAPERFESGPVDGRADVYALACVLFACLTSRRPFSADGTAAQIWAHLNEAPPKASPLNPEVPAALDVVIAKGMAKNPADRYATAGAFARAAAEALAAPGGAIPPATPPVGQLGLAGATPPATPPAGQLRPAGATPPAGQPTPPTPPGGHAAPPIGWQQPVAPVPHGRPHFSQPPQPVAPVQRVATGPQQVTPPLPYPPTRAQSGPASPAKRIALAGGVLAVVAAIVATVLIIGNGDRTLGSGTSSSTPARTTTTSTTTTTTSATPTRTPQDDALLAALPAVYQTAKSCVPIAADKGTVATARCTTVTVDDPWAPPPAEAEFRLFADQARQNEFFQDLVTSRGIPRMDERGGCRPKSDPIHYALYYRDTSGPLPNEFTTCFLDGGNAQVWWVDTRKLTIGTLKKPGDVDTLDKLDLWWNHQILTVL